MEPITSAIATPLMSEIAKTVKKESEGFLKLVLGEPAKAVGALLADKVNSRRHRNLVSITAQAKRRLAEAGVSATEVPLKIIHPALEAASLEEEPSLQATWANLLANAADPRHINPVSPSFLFIPKELGVHEVRFLDELYRNTIGIVELRKKDSEQITVHEVKYNERDLLAI